MKNIFFHFFLFKRIYHFFFLRIRILFELAIRFVPSLMTNALSCYVRDKLPPCSLFLLILKIVLTFFPPSMNHCIELRRRRLIRAVRYWKCRLFFRKGKKVSVSLETGARFDYHELRRKKATVSSAIVWKQIELRMFRVSWKEINRVWENYIAWLIARHQIFITIYVYIIWIIMDNINGLSLSVIKIHYFISQLL